MKWSRVFVGFMVAIAIILITFILIPKQIIIAIPQSEIQHKIEEKFPIQKELMLFTAQLKNPIVDLQQATERVTVTITTGIQVHGSTEELTGNAVLSAGISYDTEQGIIYLTDIRVEQLNILPLPMTLVQRVTNIINGIFTDVIERVPIHTLKRDEWKQRAIKWVLQDVAIADHELIVTLGR